jgi:HSP20 family protein
MFVVPLSRSAGRTRAVPAFSTALDRLFDESFDRYLGGAKADVEARTPTMDVSESDSSYLVVLDVPGATREQLKVSVEGRRVTLNSALASETPAQLQAEGQPAADSKPTVETKGADRVLYRERSTAVYSRTIVLPTEVDQAASQAKFENGVLTLTLAKKVPAGATQLSIG